MDHETGSYHFHKKLVPGMFCRALSDNIGTVELHLRPSTFVVSPASVTYPKEDPSEILGMLETNPSAHRSLKQKQLMLNSPRPHAVCTVQTFRNPMTGKIFFS